MINGDRGYAPDDEYHKVIHEFGLATLRVASAARASEGNEGVRKFYTAFGTSYHNLKNARVLILTRMVCLLKF